MTNHDAHKHSEGKVRRVTLVTHKAGKKITECCLKAPLGCECNPVLCLERRFFDRSSVRFEALSSFSQ